MSASRQNSRSEEIKRAALNAQAKNEDRKQKELDDRVNEDLNLKHESNETQKKLLWVALSAVAISILSLLVSIMAYINSV